MAVTLGLRMEEMIFNLADTHLFFNDLEVRIKGILTPVFLVFNLVALLCISVYCVSHFLPMWSLDLSCFDQREVSQVALTSCGTRVLP